MSINMNPAVNRRSLIAGVAGLGAAGILAGCSNEGSGSGSSDSASGTAFKIGAIGPLTGDTASYGTSTTNGVELGTKDFSTEDFPLTSKKEDSQGNAETAVNAYNSLMDWGMQALVGPTLTGCSVAVAQSCQQDRTFMLTPSATSEDVTADKDCVFQVCFTDPNQGVNAAKYVAEKYADEKIAILYQNDDAYSKGIRDAFVAQGEESKLQIVADDLAFTKDTQTDFNVQLGKAQQAGATMVFAPIYYTPASVLLQQANKMGYKFTLMGCDGMDGLLGVENFDTSLAEGVLLMTPFSADDEKNADFVNAYKEAYGEVPDQFAADAYDGVHAVAEAAKKAGLTPDTPAEEACDKLAQVMLEIEVDGITGKLTWTENGEVSKEPTAYVIKDGKYVTA